MKPRSAVLLVVLVSLMLSACGGGGKPTTTTTTGIIGDSGSNEANADSPIIQPLVIAQSDLPNGWIATAPREDDQTDVDTAGLINQCVGVASDIEIQVVKRKGNDFTNGRNRINSDAESYVSPALAEQYFSGLNNVNNFRCVAQVLDTAVSNGLNGQGTTRTGLGKISGVTTNDAFQYALRLTTIITVGSAETPVYSDIMGVRNGRFAVSINVTYFETPPPVELDKILLATATQRLASVTAQ